MTHFIKSYTPPALAYCLWRHIRPFTQQGASSQTQYTQRQFAPSSNRGPAPDPVHPETIGPFTQQGASSRPRTPRDNSHLHPTAPRLCVPRDKNKSWRLWEEENYVHMYRPTYRQTSAGQDQSWLVERTTMSVGKMQSPSPQRRCAVIIVVVLVITRLLALDRVQTHAGHSITWNMFLHFVTLWPCPLTFWPNIKQIARTHHGLSMWKVWWWKF